jgi:hypothetical protein
MNKFYARQLGNELYFVIKKKYIQTRNPPDKNNLMPFNKIFQLKELMCLIETQHNIRNVI